MSTWKNSQLVTLSEKVVFIVVVGGVVRAEAGKGNAQKDDHNKQGVPLGDGLNPLHSRKVQDEHKY